MNETQGAQDPNQVAAAAAANAAQLIKKLDSWLTCHNLTESFLIITNFLLLLKSSSNLVAVFNDSRSLIIDYNGSILFSDGFRWCFIMVNLGVLIGSLLCLLALLFASAPKSKLKLLKYFVISQLTLAFITLLLMGRLWFAPFKVELDQEAWKWTIRRYNYQFKPDTNGLWPNGLPLRVHDPAQLQEEFGRLAAYDYRDKVDKLQQALGCCGVWSPNEWRQNELLGLLAPSCCLNPTRVDVEFPVINPPQMMVMMRQPEIIGDQMMMNNETQQVHHQPPILVYNMKQIFYCQWGQSVDNWSGCQQQLNDKDTRFLFKLRLNLLLLIGVLFLNVMSQALLKFDPIQIDSSLILQVGGGERQSTIILDLHQTPANHQAPNQLPPTYEQSRGQVQVNHNITMTSKPPSYSPKRIDLSKEHSSQEAASGDSRATQHQDLRLDNHQQQQQQQQPGDVEQQQVGSRNDATVLTML